MVDIEKIKQEIKTNLEALGIAEKVKIRNENNIGYFKGEEDSAPYLSFNLPKPKSKSEKSETRRKCKGLTTLLMDRLKQNPSPGFPPISELRIVYKKGESFRTYLIITPETDIFDKPEFGRRTLVTINKAIKDYQYRERHKD